MLSENRFMAHSVRARRERHAAKKTAWWHDIQNEKALIPNAICWMPATWLKLTAGRLLSTAINLNAYCFMSQVHKLAANIIFNIQNIHEKRNFTRK